MMNALYCHSWVLKSVHLSGFIIFCRLPVSRVFHHFSTGRLLGSFWFITPPLQCCYVCPYLLFSGTFIPIGSSPSVFKHAVNFSHHNKTFSSCQVPYHLHYPFVPSTVTNPGKNCIRVFISSAPILS